MAAPGPPKAADDCRLWLAGRFRGTTTDGIAVHGRYRGWTDVSAAEHAPGCLESGGGRLSYLVRDGSGRLIGTVMSMLDRGDSEICQSDPESTDRAFFLRGDPVSGTGAFAGVQSGNTLVQGTGTRICRSQTYRTSAAFLPRVD